MLIANMMMDTVIVFLVKSIFLLKAGLIQINHLLMSIYLGVE